jgi:hypothetical protein
MKMLRICLAFLLVLFLFIFDVQSAWAFCGFYVAKADANLYNQASQVIIARDGDRTILTMANDYQGDVQDFALVVPVPVVLKQEQVHVSEGKIIERLDAFSAPRLVEYFDPDPCQVGLLQEDALLRNAPQAESSEMKSRGNDALGVTIEEQFSVGEYNILILSAKESDGLETWLIQNGYKIPSGASELLQPYIRQNMKFFVAKVNLKEYNNQGFQKLRPLAIAYESPKFMLPIRLGMVNGKGEQDLLVYLLSPKGQVELTNYRTVKVPSDVDIPEFVKQEFSDFYKAMFAKTHQKEGQKVAFVEYAWDMNSCDPCSAEPLNPEELKQAGVFWLDSNQGYGNVFITRLHIRYSRNTFPQDLQFQQTANNQFFQGRYVIRHPFTGNITCNTGYDYKRSIHQRQEREAQTLAQLTGWDIQNIRNKINFVESAPESLPWWRKIWQ